MKRRVALKIVKLGMNTKQVVARFEAERQALALMDHPNIGKVLDAGTTENGRPYFVMELVKGIPITQYCKQEKLEARARLELFIKVCHAVQHAHQKGIIHRDIKPANILVTLHDGVPVPKVIDFGIAKATQAELTEKTVYTQFNQFIGTPAYISPEQAEMSGLDIDTRSDIYSLGVLLYELLTGSTPFDTRELMQSGLDEMRKIIREREPLRPSTRLTQNADMAPSQQQVQRLKIEKDLDWIVMKCLEKDRIRRYETTNGLALDLKRYLNHEPVVARPPSAVYRFRKAWRRNKAVISAGVAVILALVIGGSLSVWLAIRETRAREQAFQAQLVAEKERDKATTAKELAEQEAAKTRQNDYRSDMNLAAQVWERGNLVQVRKLLQQHRPSPEQEDLRGFEWQLLWGLVHQDKTRFSFDMSRLNITTLELSPEGEILLLGDQEGKLRIIDLTTGKERAPFRGHASAIRALAFSPARRWLASGGANGTIRLWDTTSWTMDASFTGHKGPVDQLTFPPGQNNLISVSDDKTVRFWNLDTRGQAHLVDLSNEIEKNVTLSPDGKFLAEYGGLSAVVKFWEVGPPLRELAPLPQQKGLIFSVRFSQDSKTAIIPAHDSRVTKWDMQSMARLQTYWPQVLIPHIELSSDGSVLVTAGKDKVVKVWNAASGQQLRVLRGHTTTIHHLVLSEDGSTAVSADANGQVKVWATNPKNDKFKLFHNGIVVYMDVSPDGQTLAAGDLGSFKVELWDLSTRQHSTFLSDAKYEMAFSPNGEWLATRRVTQPCKVQLWDCTDTPYTPQGPAFPSDFSVGYNLRFSSNGILAFRGPDNSIHLLDSNTLSRIGQLPDHEGYFLGTAFSPDGELIATSDVMNIRRWDISNPEDPSKMSSLRGHTAEVHAVAFSPDGETLATGSYDGTLKLWDPISGHELVTLSGHSSVIQCLTWSPDGQTIFTGNVDGTVQIWRARSSR